MKAAPDSRRVLVTKLEFQPAADLFPLMSDDELNALADDMLEHGQLEPIVLFHGLTAIGFWRLRSPSSSP